MDELIKQLLPSLGAFAPVAVLGWWFLKTLREDLKQERDRNQELTDKLIALSDSTARTLSDLTNVIRSNTR